VIAVLDHCCIERLCFVHGNGVFGSRAVERKGGGAGGVLFGGNWLPDCGDNEPVGKRRGSSSQYR
jgi:hypothetical protein